MTRADRLRAALNAVRAVEHPDDLREVSATAERLRAVLTKRRPESVKTSDVYTPVAGPTQAE